MTTEYMNKKLEALPKDILVSLREFLNDNTRFDLIERQLDITGIMLEKDNFQIPLHSIDDLREIKAFLNGNNFLS